MATEQIIDLHLLQPFTGDNIQLQQQLILAFQNELSAFYASMKNDAVNNSLESVRVLYHRISPSLKMLELKQLIEPMDSYKQLLSANDSNAEVKKAQLLTILTVTENLLAELKRLAGLA